MILYKSNANFQVFDFSATHSQLLLRSYKTKFRRYHIDIIFKAVNILLLPTSIETIEIKLLNDKEKILDLKTNFGFDDEHHHTFTVKDANDRSFYINAMAFGIFHNELKHQDTSIGRYDWGDLGELQKWFKAPFK